MDHRAWVELCGGALLLIGHRARSAAVVIAAFTLATAMFFHRNFADQNQLIHFFKNLIIVGGLLQPGPLTGMQELNGFGSFVAT